MASSRKVKRCTCSPNKGLHCKVCHGKNARREIPVKLKPGDKNWKVECEVCCATPTVHPTGLCGPCCFGESDTLNGNW